MKKLAYSTWSCKYIDDIFNLVDIGLSNNIEWDLNFIPPTLSYLRLNIIKQLAQKKAIDIRFHLPYSFFDIAHCDRNIANCSLQVLFHYLDFIYHFGGKYAILHIGYFDNCEEELALNNLRLLASYAKNLGICICIENLIKGLTTRIDFLINALSIDNVYLCIDSGHADVVSKNNSNYWCELLKLSSFCVHSHFYKTEDSLYNHIAFENTTELFSSRLAVDLLNTSCDWFTMEVDSRFQQENQMKMIYSFFQDT